MGAVHRRRRDRRGRVVTDTATTKCNREAVGAARHPGTVAAQTRGDGEACSVTAGETASPATDDWRVGTWACLDIERTGLGSDDRIIEIAIVTMREGAVVESWSSLVNPGISIPAEATGVHGIVDEMVVGQPTIAQLKAEIVSRLARADAIVAYAGFQADFGWLASEIGPLPDVPQIDPLVIVRSPSVGKYWKGDYVDRSCPICDEDKPEAPPTRKTTGRHRLTTAAERFGLLHPEPGFEQQAHRAAWDALLCGRVLWHLRGFCSRDPRVCESRLRAEAERQEYESAAFRDRMRAEDQAKRERRKASMGLEIKQLRARLDELEPYVAKLEAALGKSPYAGGVA